MRPGDRRDKELFFDTFTRYSSNGIIHMNYSIHTERGVIDVSIKQIEIKHFKLIDSCVLTLENINLFIGENGTGKSNVLDAARYFFESMLADKDDEGIYDINNKFSNELSVSITFDFTRLQKISRNNVHRNSETGYADYYDWITTTFRRKNNFQNYCKSCENRRNMV